MRVMNINSRKLYFPYGGEVQIGAAGLHVGEIRYFSDAEIDGKGGYFYVNAIDQHGIAQLYSAPIPRPLMSNAELGGWIKECGEWLTVMFADAPGDGEVQS